jgi:hypothetical protein
MPAIIDSAPDCIAHVNGAVPADDSADFIINAAYDPCRDAGGGIMTFGHGSIYGDGGVGATTSYYVLTWIGIIVMVVVIIAWMLYENRQLLGHAARLSVRGVGGGGPSTGEGA